MKKCLLYGLNSKEDTVVFGFFSNLILTVVIAFVTNYAIIPIFQNIKSHIKLFLLIAALLLMYGRLEKMHLSSLIIYIDTWLAHCKHEVVLQRQIVKVPQV